MQIRTSTVTWNLFVNISDRLPSLLTFEIELHQQRQPVSSKKRRIVIMTIEQANTMLPHLIWFILILSPFISPSAANGNGGQMADVIAVKEGADLDLSCPIVVQSEDMIISWTCDNEPANIRSSRIHVTEAGKLRIRSAKVGDSCNYRCEAADGFGTLSVITRVIIVDKKLIENLGRPNQTTQNSHPESAKQSKLAYNNNHHVQKAQKDWKKIGEQLATGDKNKLTAANTQPQQQGDLDVQVEPANLQVAKNQTFSLECRVTHAIHLRQPQIIWLKEYLGRRPGSANDADDQSLVFIDGVHYHSLNWPRSTTLSRKPSSEHHTASSVLLVRHSTYVHSGRYACFAGYPPYVMSSNFSSDPTTLSFLGQIKPLKYKVAVSHVKVDDPENELKHKRLLGAWQNQEWSLMRAGEENLLISVFSTNSWMRNLALSLMLLCVLLIALKFIRTNRLERIQKKKLKREAEEKKEDSNSNSNNKLSPLAILSTNNLLEGSLAVKQIDSSGDLPRPYRLVDCSSGSTRASHYEQDCLEVLSTPLDLSKSSLTQSGENPTEHVYSEIGLQKEELTPPLEPYYQVPRARNLV